MRGVALCLLVGCTAVPGCNDLLEPPGAPTATEEKDAPSRSLPPPPPPPPPPEGLADAEPVRGQQGTAAEIDKTPPSAPEQTDAASGEVITGQRPTTAGPAITIPVKITISKETTYVLGPLRDHGYVDYLAALNGLYRQGVTGENNAAIPFWEAVGPNAVPDELRTQFFGLLGIPRLPDEGHYFVPFGIYVDSRGVEGDVQADRQLDLALKGPWARDECPTVARWLEANEIPLRRIAEATRRPRFYSPLVRVQNAPTLIEVLMPVHQARPVARALAARALLRTHNGEVEAAWEDLLACHRLARLVGQGPIALHGLMAIAIDGIACRGDATLARHAKVSAEQAAEFQKDLSSLAPFPTMADKIDKGERLIFLDMVCAVAREGPGVLAWGDDAPKESLSHPPAEVLKAVLGTIDWDETLRMGNASYDRIVEAVREPGRAARRQALAKLYQEHKRLHAKATDPKSLVKSLFSAKSPEATMGRHIGRELLQLLLPDFRAAAIAEDRAETNLRLAQLALALAAHRSDHGLYPRSLSELAPDYMLDVPKDVFSGRDLRYSRRGQAYLLYSVGPNEKDDGGRGYDSAPEGDDIAIRTSSQKP